VIFALHAHRGLLSAQVGEDSVLVVDMKDDCGCDLVCQKQVSQPAKPMPVAHQRWHSQAAVEGGAHSRGHRRMPEAGTGTRVAHHKLYMAG
jgi:hypothetical protein